MIIFMNHLASFIHAFEHKHDADISSSEIVNFAQDAAPTKICVYCQTYVNLEYTQHESVEYSLIALINISERIPDTEKLVPSLKILRKKSRSPPTYNS